MKTPPLREYINVMELLVAEEVEYQLHQLPARVLKYVKSIEVETYALNRLPPLYAVSEKGWQAQYHRANHELRQKISNAVRQAIAAVQVDPLRASRPLVCRPATSSSNAVLLKQFRAALGQPNLTWESLLRKCKRAGAAKRKTTAHKPATDTPPGSYSSSIHRADECGTSAVPNRTHHHHSTHQGTVWRPGTYGETSWRPSRDHGYHAPTSPASVYDWNDSRYR
ncbi:MAG: late competence development ComFB family protein [Symploca sp. SIO2G7]|nr:late competence development ComFB family protein [Symploca sp. SIO2G7]